jgi:hypothetical protein
MFMVSWKEPDVMGEKDRSTVQEAPVTRMDPEQLSATMVNSELGGSSTAFPAIHL